MLKFSHNNGENMTLDEIAFKITDLESLQTKYETKLNNAFHKGARYYGRIYAHFNPKLVKIIKKIELYKKVLHGLKNAAAKVPSANAVNRATFADRRTYTHCLRNISAPFYPHKNSVKVPITVASAKRNFNLLNSQSFLIVQKTATRQNPIYETNNQSPKGAHNIVYSYMNPSVWPIHPFKILSAQERANKLRAKILINQKDTVLSEVA